MWVALALLHCMEEEAVSGMRGEEAGGPNVNDSDGGKGEGVVMDGDGNGSDQVHSRMRIHTSRWESKGEISRRLSSTASSSSTQQLQQHHYQQQQRAVAPSWLWDELQRACWPVPDTTAYNVTLTALARAGRVREAVTMVRDMRRYGCVFVRGRGREENDAKSASEGKAAEGAGEGEGEAGDKGEAKSVITDPAGSSYPRSGKQGENKELARQASTSDSEDDVQESPSRDAVVHPDLLSYSAILTVTATTGDAGTASVVQREMQRAGIAPDCVALCKVG